MDHVVLVRRTGKIALSEMVSILLFVFILCFLNYAGHCNNLLCAYSEFLLGVAKRKECVIPWDLSNTCYSGASRKQSHFSWQWELKRFLCGIHFQLIPQWHCICFLLVQESTQHLTSCEVCHCRFDSQCVIDVLQLTLFFFFFLVRPGTVDKINL